MYKIKASLLLSMSSLLHRQLHHFVRLLKLPNCRSIMAASSKFVNDAIKCIHICVDGKGNQIQPRSVEHKATFRA